MATMFSSCNTDETDIIMWVKDLRFSAYVSASYIDMFRLFPKSNPVESNVNGYDFSFYLQTEDGHFFTMYAMCEGEGMGKEVRWTLRAETDEIANKAVETFENLTDLGFNVDSRYASELFAVAGTMLGHALTAKQTKLQKKLKVIELQMKKLKLDQDAARAKGTDPEVEPAQGKLMSRNDLLEMLKASKE